MAVFLIKPVVEVAEEKYDYLGYTWMQGAVVRAENEQEARRLVEIKCQRETGLWLDPQAATCSEVLANGDGCVIFAGWGTG